MINRDLHINYGQNDEIVVKRQRYWKTSIEAIRTKNGNYLTWNDIKKLIRNMKRTGVKINNPETIRQNKKLMKITSDAWQKP